MAKMNTPNDFGHHRMDDDSDTDDDGDTILPHRKLMEKPLKFIEWKKGGDFELNQTTVQLLQQLYTPIVVVAITGIYRTGKSYLLNLFAGKQTGFELGSTVESKTKGIWIWCLPHPNIPDTTLILMDTEGSEDARSGDDNREMQIIVLALLLSSTFIYNTSGRVDSSLIKQLGFVSELTNHIQVKTSSNDSSPDDADFDLYFPSLVVTVRDFVLGLEIRGKNITASEFFEDCLELKDSSTSKGRVADYNEPRIKIRKYFPQSKRHCFVLPQPVKNFCHEYLSTLPYLPKDEMNPEFLTKSEEYRRLILGMSQHKSFGQIDQVNGRMFVDMAAAYVTAMLSGQMPCIQSALKLTAAKENRRLLEESLEQYDMRILLLNFPLSQSELLQQHETIVHDIIKTYKQKIIFEESEDFGNEFKSKVTAAYNKAIEFNENSSREKCEGILKDLNADIEKKMTKKVYLCSGGYDIYYTDLTELKNKYNEMERLGVKSEHVLFEFLQRKESEINNVITSDIEMNINKVKEEADKRLRQEIELREKMIRLEVEQAKNREAALQKTHMDAQKAMAEETERRFEQQRKEYEKLLRERQKTCTALASEMKHKEALKKSKSVGQKLKNACTIL